MSMYTGALKQSTKASNKRNTYVSGDLMITASFYCTAPLTCSSNCMSTSPWYGSHMQMKPSKWRALSRIICIWLRTGYLHYILFTNTCKQNLKSNLITEQILHPHFVQSLISLYHYFRWVTKTCLPLILPAYLSVCHYLMINHEFFKVASFLEWSLDHRLLFHTTLPLLKSTISPWGRQVHISSQRSSHVSGTDEKDWIRPPASNTLAAPFSLSRI